jgi:TolA-binding protein
MSTTMTTGEQQPTEDLNELRGEIAAVRGLVEQALQTQLDNQSEQIDDVDGRVDELEARLGQLEAQFESIVGPGDGETTPHQKRKRAVRQMMANQARARDGRVQWDYNDVTDSLEANGHGTVHPPQAYRLIDDVAEHDAFGKGENNDGAKVVRCNADLLPEESGVNNVNNAEAVAATDGGVSSSETTDETT